MKKHLIILSLSLVLVGLQTANAQEKYLTSWSVLADSLEYRQGDEDERLFAWGLNAWYGTDKYRAIWKSEGEYDLREKAFENLENQILLTSPVSDFFDIQAGLRFDTPKGPDRTYAVLGLSGLAPQWIETDSSLFLSEKGDLSARFEAEYELLLDNYWILTPEIELDAAFSDDEEIEIAAGFTSVEAGLRLSYDLVDRNISPYIGIAYERVLGNTADIRREEGEDIDGWRGLVGLRVMF